MSDVPTTVGVIGTGQIGARMARRLSAAGYSVVVHDRDPDAAAGLAGVDVAASAAEVAGRCEAIITCLTDSTSVEEVVLGPGGIHEALRPDHLVIETTTSSPATTRKLAAALRGQGADLIDAPVSRGVPAAERGDLAFMVGGSQRSLARARPLLAVLGTDVVATGDVGTGHLAKALNMQVMAVNFVATAEALALARALGNEEEAMLADLNASPAESFVSNRHFPRYVLPAAYESGFTLRLMRKDLGIAAEVAQEAGIEPPLGAIVRSLYRWADARGLGLEDNTRIVELPACQEASGHHCRKALSAGSCERSTIATALLGVVALGTLEALAVAHRTGLSPRVMLDVLAVSSGGSACSRAWTREWGSTNRAAALALESAPEALAAATQAAVRCESPWWTGSVAGQIARVASCDVWRTDRGVEAKTAAMLRSLAGRAVQVGGIGTLHGLSADSTALEDDRVN